MIFVSWMKTAVNNPGEAVNSNYKAVCEYHGNIKPLKQRGKFPSILKGFLEIITVIYILLVNGVRGPYCKLRTRFFSPDLWPKRETRGP